MDFQTKIATLKQYESECYQVCYYLARNDKTACKAAEEAMVTLFTSEDFWTADELKRRKAVQRAAMGSCMKLLKHEEIAV
ncbi:hypothetical protein [Paenibacillus sp. SYP-B4298]|uniref:hypothetical protein n=1 Tax=Paenibacillus sp. SYP-B4298 TaxID=2996034 RepID=UPI0022DDAD05|nr:hypothetical protein [Paenibacillus sp. SYP-B4298]